MYYAINEDAARFAHNINSFFPFVEGKATKEYRDAIDRVAGVVATKKKLLGSSAEHDLDSLLDSYARKLADWYNRGFSIEARCPSIMVSGGANFPVRKKEKQNAARDRHMQEYETLNALARKIENFGTGGISADDPDCIDKLREKLTQLENQQDAMKIANAYWRKHGSMCGYNGMGIDAAQKWDGEIMRRNSWARQPYEPFLLTNNNANIKRIKERIVSLERLVAAPPEGWDFDGGTVVINIDVNRLQILFNEKPPDDLRTKLKKNGFKWAPSQSAWQRQLNDNAVRAAHTVLS